MLGPGVFDGAKGPRGVQERWHLVVRSWEGFLRRCGRSVGGCGNILGESVGGCSVRQGAENKNRCEKTKHGSTESAAGQLPQQTERRKMIRAEMVLSNLADVVSKRREQI